MRQFTRDELHKIITEEHARAQAIEPLPEHATTVQLYADSVGVARSTAFERLEALVSSGVLVKDRRVIGRARTNIYIFKERDKDNG